MSESEFEEVVKNKNKNKLLYQNKKLYNELKRLQIQIQSLEDQPEPIQQSQQISQDLKLQLQNQARQIKRLKQQSEIYKQQNVKQNVIFIRKEEDELIFMKKEMQGLMQQKEVIGGCHQDKLKKLADNQPLQKHKDGIQTLWAQTKKQNRQINHKLVQIQREIRKYHSLKERAKTISDTPIRIDEEARMEYQIQRMNAEIKAAEVKWKPNMEILDKELFTLKNSLLGYQRKLEDVEREDNSWKVRASALRDQNKLDTDHTRISKLVAMPKSQQQKKVEDSHRYYVNSAFSGHQKSGLININKSSEMVRAESTPNSMPSAKRVLDLMNLKQDIQAKKRARRSLRKEEPEKSSINVGQKQMLGSFQKIKDSKKFKIAKQSNQVPQIPYFGDKVAEIKQTGGNKISFTDVREKHRGKANIVPDLAQQIKKKVNDVKKDNQGLIVEPKVQSRSKKVSTKSKVKEPQIQAIQLQPIKQHQVKGKNKKQNVKQLPNPKIVKQKSKSSLQVTSTKFQSKINESPIQKTKQKIKNKEAKAKSIEKQKRQKEISESINLKIPDNKVGSNSRIPLQRAKPAPVNVGSKPKLQTLPSPPKQIEPVSPKKKVKTIQSPPASPKSPKKVQKPRFQIMISDKMPKSSNLDKLRVEVVKRPEQQQNTDDIPKIIKRKRPAKSNLVTSSTST